MRSLITTWPHERGKPSNRVIGFVPSEQRKSPREECELRPTIGFISRMEWKMVGPEETFAAQAQRFAHLPDDEDEM